MKGGGAIMSTFQAISLMISACMLLVSLISLIFVIINTELRNKK